MWSASVCLSTVRLRRELCHTITKWCQCWSSSRLPREARRRGSEDGVLPGREESVRAGDQAAWRREAEKVKATKSPHLKWFFLLLFCCSLCLFPSALDPKVRSPLKLRPGVNNADSYNMSAAIMGLQVSFSCAPLRGSQRGQPSAGTTGSPPASTGDHNTPPRRRAKTNIINDR